jgi:hypothetical protein
MNEPIDKLKRKMPKGGRKGGAIFPRICLKDAIGYAKKLVSKTHVQSQQIDIIYSGVVGAKGSKGNIRISALKQYGFIEGDRKSGFKATELAKKLSSAPPGESEVLLKSPALLPIIFKKIFDTYQNDTVSRAKLKQRASELKVHPDETETCVKIYLKSLELAKLLTVNGDQITHSTIYLEPTDIESTTIDEELGVDAYSKNFKETLDDQKQSTEKHNDSSDSESIEIVQKPRAVFNVNISLDSSMDIEKLAKQLELLKKFGAI